MPGHLEWSTIKQKKEEIDGIKAKIFTKIGRGLVVTVKESEGSDPRSNSGPKDCTAKVKAANVPNGNIERIIRKAADDGDDTKHESIVCEGYGPSGVAVIVEAPTDNRNHTAADIRHYFDKFNGNLGTSSCVSSLFSQKDMLMTEREGLPEDTVMTDCLRAGVADFRMDDDMFEIYIESDNFSAVLSDLEGKGYEFVSVEVETVPTTYAALSNPDSVTKMQKLLDNLEDNDDVWSAQHNWENADDAG